MSSEPSNANPYDRDLIGYGPTPPAVNWPGGARIALQFVLNYEEGGERCVLHGDNQSETFLSEIIGARPIEDRHLSMESLYEYGSRVGVWRILELFSEFRLPLTVFAVAMALKRNPRVVETLLESGHEICSHGWRWIDYQAVDEATEREHMQLAIDTHAALTGERPLGWYTGRTSPNTRRLLIDEGGFLYDADDYSDDLPFWIRQGDDDHLVVPYTLDNNDMRFLTPQGFHTGEQFYRYLRDSFDTLYAEGEKTPRMMSVGLHCRIIGRPGRFQALRQFLDYVRRQDDVWICQRIDIARHWINNHPPETA